MIGGGDAGEYPCTRCGRNYKYKYNLKRHLKYECGVEPKFECPECHIKMKDKGNLYKHARMKHGLELCVKKYTETNYY